MFTSSAATRLFKSLPRPMPRSLQHPPPGTPAAHPGGLRGVTRGVVEAIAGIDSQAWPADKALALERIRQDRLESLLDHLQRLHAPDAASSAGHPADHPRDVQAASRLVDLLAHGPELLRMFPGDRHLHDGWAWQQSVALRQRLHESAETFAILRDDPARSAQALAYAALVPSELHEEFLGHRLQVADDLAVGRLRQAAGTERGLLSGEDILLLRDYAHAQTRSFNFYRALHCLGRDPETAEVHTVFEALEDRLASAIRRIWELPAARCAGPLYKGWIPVPSLPLGPGATFDIDRPLSAAADRAHSYALRRSRGGRRYSDELEFRDGPRHGLQAVNLQAFHAPRTAPQAEAVLLPDQCFAVDRTGVEIRPGPGGESPAADEPVKVHRLCRTADRHLPAG